MRFGIAATTLGLGLILLGGFACGDGDKDIADATTPTPEPAVRIDSIEPSAGTIGDEIVIKGSGFSLTNNDIEFGPLAIGTNWDAGYLNQISSEGGTTIRFELRDTLGACAFTQLPRGSACPDIGLILPVGEIDIAVLNEDGKSNKVKFTREGSPIEEAQHKVNESPVLQAFIADMDARVAAALDPATGQSGIGYGFGFEEEDGEVYVDFSIQGVDLDVLDIPEEIEGYEVRVRQD